MSQSNWDFNEFLAFFLIYAAHADIDFSDEEKKQIKEAVTEDVFDNIYAQFNELTDYQALEAILNYKDIYYSAKEEKAHLLDELHKLFNADGEYSILEKELMMFLTKLI